MEKRDEDKFEYWWCEPKEALGISSQETPKYKIRVRKDQEVKEGDTLYAIWFPYPTPSLDLDRQFRSKITELEKKKK